MAIVESELVVLFLHGHLTVKIHTTGLCGLMCELNTGRYQVTLSTDPVANFYEVSCSCVYPTTVEGRGMAMFENT